MPGLNNFVGELLALTAMVNVYPLLTAVGALGIVLGAWYSFRLTQRILFGHYDAGRRQDTTATTQLTAGDLFPGQKAVFTVLAILSLAIGIQPLGAMKLFRSDVERIAAVSATASRALQEPVQMGAAAPAAPRAVQLTSAR
jgi:NADH:ubiquinone oxidoreductase subunit 4 (subunit M)